MRLILASTSPRRRELLSLLQISFEVVEPVVEEHIRPDLSPIDQARLFAERKVRHCEHRFPDSLIIGSDTLIEWTVGFWENRAHPKTPAAC